MKTIIIILLLLNCALNCAELFLDFEPERAEQQRVEPVRNPPVQKEVKEKGSKIEFKPTFDLAPRKER